MSGSIGLPVTLFITKLKNSFNGGKAILFGCGSPPYRNIDFRNIFKRNFKLHFYTGQNDKYLRNAINGYEYYKNNGFNVTSDFPDGVNHRNIEFAKVLNSELN